MLHCSNRPQKHPVIYVSVFVTPSGRKISEIKQIKHRQRGNCMLKNKIKHMYRLFFMDAQASMNKTIKKFFNKKKRNPPRVKFNLTYNLLSFNEW